MSATDTVVEVVSIRPKTSDARQVSHKLCNDINLKEKKAKKKPKALQIVSWLYQNILRRLTGVICCPVDGARVPVMLQRK